MLKKLISSARNIMNVRGLALTGMLISVYAVLGYFKIPPTGNNRVTLTFAAVAVTGIVLGPVPAMLVGAIGDFLAFLMNSGGGPYFLGYALTAVLVGLIYGFCLYGINLPDKSKKSKLRVLLIILLANLLIAVFANILLNTLWLSMTNGKAFVVLIWPRIVKNIFTAIGNTIVVYILFMLIEREGIRKKYL